MPWATNISFLQPCFFGIKSTFADNNIKLKLKAIRPLFLFETNLKLFFARILKNSLYL